MTKKVGSEAVKTGSRAHLATRREIYCYRYIAMLSHSPMSCVIRPQAWLSDIA